MKGKKKKLDQQKTFLEEKTTEQPTKKQHEAYSYGIKDIEDSVKGLIDSYENKDIDDSFFKQLSDYVNQYETSFQDKHNPYHAINNSKNIYYQIVKSSILFLPEQKKKLISVVFGNKKLYNNILKNYIQYQYEKTSDKDDSNTRLSNFIISVTKTFIDKEKNLTYEFELSNYFDTIKIYLTGDILASVNDFQKILLQKGVFFFTGQKNDLYSILEFELNSRDKKIIYQVEQLGYSKQHDIWIYPNICVYKGDVIYPDDDDIFWYSSKGFKYISINGNQGDGFYGGVSPFLNYTGKDIEIDKDIIFECFKDLIGDKGDYSGLIGLGFIGATIYSDIIFNIPEIKAFPRLDLIGITESGKTTYGSLIMKFFGFDVDGDQYTETTQNFVMKTMNYLSNVPYWLDEYTASNTKSRGLKESFVKGIYNRSGSGKGKVGGTQGYSINSPLIVSGEDIFQTPSVKSRGLRIDFQYKNETRTEENKKAFHTLIRHKELFPEILIQAVKERTSRTKKENIEVVSRLILSYFEDFKKVCTDDRISKNFAIAITGLQLLGYQDMIEIYPDIVGFFINKLKETSTSNKETDTVTTFLRKVITLIHLKKIESKYLRLNQKHNISLAFEVCFHQVKKESEINFSGEAVKKYLLECGFCINKIRTQLHDVTIDGKHHGAIIFDYDKSPDFLQQFVDNNESFE